jgi:SAM-dependent methyltransferase
MVNNTYDDFSQDYDRFVNWGSRLEAEIPFVEERLGELDLPKGQKPCVLDAACGTGMHAIELARRGYRAIAVNPRGIRGSTGPLENITYHDYAADVAALIDRVA